MKEIMDIVKRKYEINNAKYICIDDIELLEFELNAYVNVNIFKINGEYTLLLSTFNNNAFPKNNITIRLHYKLLEDLKNDLENFRFTF